MGFVSDTLTIEGDAGASSKSTVEFRGLIHTIVYEHDATNPYDGSTTVTAVANRDKEMPAETVLNAITLTASTTWRPRAANHTTAGVASSLEPVALSNSSMTFTVTGGGAGKTGRFHVIIQT